MTDVRQQLMDGIDALLETVEREREKERVAGTADYWRWGDVGSSLRNAHAQLRIFA